MKMRNFSSPSSYLRILTAESLLDSLLQATNSWPYVRERGDVGQYADVIQGGGIVICRTVELHECVANLQSAICESV
jgi:hypothetical protein